jgi:hypothetical protein
VPTELITNDRKRAEVLSLLREREPASTVPLIAMQRNQPRRQATKVWVTRNGEGRVVGLLVSGRYSFDRWYATLLLDDVAYAAEVAAVLDRSNAWSLIGPVDGVEAVLAKSRRVRSAIRLWFYAIPPQPPEPAVESFGPNTGIVVRPAVRGDVEALVDLAALDEHNGAIPRRRLRQVVIDRLPHTLVAADGGRVVGTLATPEGQAYRLFDQLVVHPNARGKKIGLSLLLAAGTDAVVAGRGVCGMRAMSNGLRVSHDDVLALGEAEVWAAADLRPPVRFRGHQRLRKLLEKLEGGPVTPPAPEASPYSVLPEQRGTADESTPGQAEGPAGNPAGPSVEQ